MKTPKEYSKMIKEGKLNDELIGKCIYSFNKRAKNYRDKRKELEAYFRFNRYAYDKYNNIEKNELKEDYFYSLKSDMLSCIKPYCIHRQNIGERRRVYSYQKEYKKIEKNEDDYEIVWANSYYDYEKEMRIYFVDIIDGEKYLYFLYYQIGDFGFHQPIDETDLKNYNLEILDIEDDFYTEGEDINNLLSNQFCMKIYNLYMTANGKVPTDKKLSDVKPLTFEEKLENID